MTLLLTECSMAGVVMAADSAVTRIDAEGRIIEVDRTGWKKVLKARKARAAVGYWGFIGKIHRGRFDEWLNKELEQATYSDLPSLATALADILNKACRHRPLGDGESAGLHVAGYHTWDDGEWRPFFFHVHNGPGQFEIHHVTQPLPLPFGQNLVEVRRRWVAGPRTLFEAHQDFPSKNASLEENISTTKTSDPQRRFLLLFRFVGGP
jgi:hypothetical protein